MEGTALALRPGLEAAMANRVDVFHQTGYRDDPSWRVKLYKLSLSSAAQQHAVEVALELPHHSGWRLKDSGRLPPRPSSDGEECQPVLPFS